MATLAVAPTATATLLTTEQKARAEALKIARPLVTTVPFGTPTPEVLIQVAEYAEDGRTLVLGHGYLITDFPVTESALRNDEPAVVSVLDPEPDPDEAALLGELGLDSLLMLPLSGPAGPWGLAEVYVNGRRFDRDEIARARRVAEAFGERLAALPASASAR